MSLREIAEKAGVSVATVSRVVNGVDHSKVSKETRKRVLDLVEELRYRPNPQAVALVTGRPPKTLALVIPYNSHVFESFYFTEIIRGAVDAANTRDMNISLFVPSRDAPAEAFHDGFANPAAMAGVLLIGSKIGDPAIDRCRGCGVPFVVVSSSHDDAGVSSVDCDNVAGARAAAAHLLRLGHRRIAFIGGPDDSSNAQDRFHGFQTALAESRIALEDVLVANGRFEEQGGREAMRQILDYSPRPTAVFAANDMMAVGAMKVIKRAGFRIPEDIAVVGFDDMPLAQHIEPALTTVHQPIYQVGRRAAETLLSQILEGPGDVTATRLILRTRLVVRESCGARGPERGLETAPEEARQ